MDAISQTTLSHILLNENVKNFDDNFTEVCSQGFNQKYSSIDSDNGLEPNSQQAIIWTNDS